MSAPPVPSVRRLRSTARAMSALPEPESWLDVGTGDARFPEVAKEVFPHTSFDGLDPSPCVMEAQAAERIEEAHMGRLTDPQITTRLRARYDVVSLLHHHLPRAPDSREELRAALAVLRPGGHLLYEVTLPYGTFAGDGLHAELESQGCTITASDRLPLPRALLTASRALDEALTPVMAYTGFSKTYRVIARKNASDTSAP